MESIAQFTIFFLNGWNVAYRKQYVLKKITKWRKGPENERKHSGTIYVRCFFFESIEKIHKENRTIESFQNLIQFHQILMIVKA